MIDAYQRRPPNRADVGLNMAADVKWRELRPRKIVLEVGIAIGPCVGLSIESC